MPKLVGMSVLCAIAAALAFLPISSRSGAPAQPEAELIRLDHEIIITARPDDVWAALTTPDGLKDEKPAGRLERSGGFNAMVSCRRARLEKPGDVDKEVKAWLKKAYNQA